MNQEHSRKLYEAIRLSQAQFASTGLDSSALIAAIEEYTDVYRDAIIWISGACDLTGNAEWERIRETLLR